MHVFTKKMFLSVLLLVNTIQLLGQNQNEFFSEETKTEETHIYTISYNETIKPELIYTEAPWKITHNSNIIAQGQGSSLNSVVFATPGEYTIVIDDHNPTEPNSCLHHMFPEKILLVVKPVKMQFHFDQLTFSNEIQKNLDAEGIIISVPVTIESYENTPIPDFTYKQIQTAGVGTTIKATLQEGTILTQGHQVLQYSLSGTVEESSYIMFDFIDINGQVQPYSLTTQIN